MALLICLTPVVARAQVIVHQAALDQLAGIVPAVTPPPPVAKVVVRRVYRRPAVKLVAKVAPVVVKPAVQPASVDLAHEKPLPPLAVPKPAPPVKMAAVFTTVVVDFAPGGDDLPGGAAAALAPVCKQAGPDGIVAIDAYAPADPADPSDAMRLSLSRAFAVRDALTGCGIPAAHIIPRADGAAGGDTGIARVSLSGDLKKQ
jgi:hypothetical protein